MAKKNKMGVVLEIKFGPNYDKYSEKSKETGIITRPFSDFVLEIHLKARTAG